MIPTTTPSSNSPLPDIPTTTKKRGRFIVLLIMCFGIIVILFFVFKTKLSYIINPANSSVSLSSGESCLQGSFYNLHDPANSIVTEAENQFISKTNISKQYFDTHFAFECGASAQNGEHVIYRYKVGDYATEIHLTRFKGRSDFSFDYGGFHEINSLPPKQEALITLQKCLKAKPENLEVSLFQNILTLTGSTSDYTASLNLENGSCERVHIDPYRF